MIKLASNAFLATKISFVNEIANVCEEVGADVGEVARGMGLDQRIGPSFLRAGIGYGGSCFPKDVSALKMLAGNTGYHFQLLNAVIEVNELQKRRVVQKLQKHLGSLVGKRVALLGLAFKPQHRRHARGLEPGAGGAAAGRGGRGGRLRPGRGRARPASCSTASSCATRRWRRSRAPTRRSWSPSGPSSPSSTGPRPPSRMARPLLVDGRNFLDPEAAASRGFEYEGIGGRRLTRRRAGRPSEMQAIVLVGGEGTRLRPLTATVPKPALTLVDRPFLAYMIEWLAGHGVTEVVLACGFLPDVLREALAGEEERAGVRDPLRGRARAARHRRRDPLRRRRARRATSRTASSPSTATSSPTST